MFSTARRLLQRMTGRKCCECGALDSLLQWCDRPARWVCRTCYFRLDYDLYLPKVYEAQVSLWEVQGGLGG